MHAPGVSPLIRAVTLRAALTPDLLAEHTHAPMPGSWLPCPRCHAERQLLDAARRAVLLRQAVEG